MPPFLSCMHLQNYRLGNAMFIYAALRNRTYKMNWDLKLPQGTKLDVFPNLQYKPLTQTDINQLTYMYKEPWFHYCSEFERLPPFGTTEAYFQCEKYFKEIRSDLLREFSVSQEDREKVNRFLSPAKQSGLITIGVHVRRGDYVNYKDFHPMLPLDYYKAAEVAINTLLPKSQDKLFIICSDEPDWCKQNLIFSSGINNYSHLTDVQDLALMSSCDHNIIANSSFSWWAAWLNSNENKIVIGPQTRNPASQQWFAHKGPQDTQDLYPESWIEV